MPNPNQTLRQLQSRLRRLHKVKNPTERQLARAFRIRLAIVRMTT